MTSYGHSGNQYSMLQTEVYVSGKKFIQYIDESHTVPVNHRCKTLMTVLLIRCSRKRFWYLYAQCS